MNRIIIFISIILLSVFYNCNEKKNDWDNIEKVVIFKNDIIDFKNKEIEKILSSNISYELDLEKSIQLFKKSKPTRKTKKPIWKGSSDYGLVYLKNNTIIKLKLSSVYGMFYCYNNSHIYIIDGDSELGRNRWYQIIKESK